MNSKQKTHAELTRDLYGVNEKLVGLGHVADHDAARGALKRTLETQRADLLWRIGLIRHSLLGLERA
jgi:hypothetical protein